MIVNFDLVCQIRDHKPVIDNCQQYEECRLNPTTNQNDWIKMTCEPDGFFFDSTNNECTSQKPATCIGKFNNVN